MAVDHTIIHGICYDFEGGDLMFSGTRGMVSRFAPKDAPLELTYRIDQESPYIVSLNEERRQAGLPSVDWDDVELLVVPDRDIGLWLDWGDFKSPILDPLGRFEGAPEPGGPWEEWSGDVTRHVMNQIALRLDVLLNEMGYELMLSLGAKPPSAVTGTVIDVMRDADLPQRIAFLSTSMVVPEE